MFNSIRFYWERRALTKRFEQTLTQLQTTFINAPHMQRRLEAFKSTMSLWKLKDSDRPLFFSSNTLADAPYKASCVSSIIGAAMQNYWYYCSGERGLRFLILLDLKCLDEIVDKGLEAYELIGGLAGGWRMQKKDKC